MQTVLDISLLHQELGTQLAAMLLHSHCQGRHDLRFYKPGSPEWSTADQWLRPDQRYYQAHWGSTISLENQLQNAITYDSRMPSCKSTLNSCSDRFLVLLSRLLLRSSPGNSAKMCVAGFRPVGNCLLAVLVNCNDARQVM